MEIFLNVYIGNLHLIHNKIHHAVKLTVLLLYFNPQDKIAVLKKGPTGMIAVILFSY